MSSAHGNDESDKTVDPNPPFDGIFLTPVPDPGATVPGAEPRSFSGDDPAAFDSYPTARFYRPDLIDVPIAIDEVDKGAKSYKRPSQLGIHPGGPGRVRPSTPVGPERQETVEAEKRRFAIFSNAAALVAFTALLLFLTACVVLVIVLVLT